MGKFEFIQDVPEAVLKKVGNYITNPTGSTFAIVGLPSELTGGLLARYSRSKTGLVLTLVNEFLDEDGNPSQEKGSALMDRVLNAFGDESVGELEGTHVGIEDVSQLMTKLIEDRRIGGSPIEQSTRYVKYDQKDGSGKWRYLRPIEVMKSGLGEKYEHVNDKTFEVYSEGVKRLIPHFKRVFPRYEFKIKLDRDGNATMLGEDELTTDAERRQFRNGYAFTVRCAALDVGRCLLPASTLTHLGIHANGRFYTSLISYLKSDELGESKTRANELERELKKVIPTFIKRNKVFPNYAKVNRDMKVMADDLCKGVEPKKDLVTLVDRAEYIDEVAASSLFPYTTISLQQILEVVKKLSYEKKLDILKTYKGDRKERRDRTGRGTEAGYPITYDLVGGFAEYRDLERHRMLTQQRQPLSTLLGFILPPEMVEIGLEDEVVDVVGMMEDLNSDLRHAGLETVSQYATSFNHRIRFMMGMNLREAQHLTELRTQPAGHFSYRAMTMEMARQLTARDPWAEEFLGFVNYSDPDNKISRANEQSRIVGKNINAGIDSSVDLD